MKAITLYQPWATLIAIGAKKVETRSWSTNYRGKLAIHAGKSRKFIKSPLDIYEDPFYGVTSLVPEDIRNNTHPFLLGAIIAVCELWHIDGPLGEGAAGYFAWEERAFGDLSAGRYAWYLKDIHILTEPIFISGKQRLWDWNEMENI